MTMMWPAALHGSCKTQDQTDLLRLGLLLLEGHLQLVVLQLHLVQLLLHLLHVIAARTLDLCPPSTLQRAWLVVTALGNAPCVA